MDAVCYDDGAENTAYYVRNTTSEGAPVMEIGRSVNGGETWEKAIGVTDTKAETATWLHGGVLYRNAVNGAICLWTPGEEEETPSSITQGDWMDTQMENHPRQSTDLFGRWVNAAATLSPGVYIINGRKNIVK